MTKLEAVVNHLDTAIHHLDRAGSLLTAEAHAAINEERQHARLRVAKAVALQVHLKILREEIAG